jgi:lysozyme family protein
MSNFGPCVTFTLGWEGGYSNDPHDPGGCTNRGVTLATLSAWRGERCTEQDVLTLSRSETEVIYRARYWAAVRGDDLPAGVDLMVFDFGVNAGPGRSAKFLQHAVQAVPDGYIGPATIAATKARQPQLVISALSQAQEGFYRALPGFVRFGTGWLNRCSARHKLALKMATT